MNAAEETPLEAVEIPRLAALWSALDVGGALVFLLVSTLSRSGQLHGTQVPIIGGPVAAAVGCGQWWLLRRARVGVAWIAAAVVAHPIALGFAQQVLAAGTGAVGAPSALAIYRLAIWPLLGGGLVGAAQLFCIPERFVRRARWPLARIGASFVSALAGLVLLNLLPPPLASSLGLATAALHGVFCGLAMKWILGAARPEQRELTLEELTGVPDQPEV